MKVELLSFQNVKLVEIGAKLCRGNNNIDLDNNIDEAYITNRLNEGHESIIEHVNFTFRITDISRVTTHQLVRHRIASYSQESQRFVQEKLESEGNNWAVIPDSILENETGYKIVDKLLCEIKSTWKKLTDLGFEPEDARFFLPNACKTSILVSMNARSLLNFFNFRICSRAQWEIRRMAKIMYHLVLKNANILFKDWTPRCERGCPEKCKNFVCTELDDKIIEIKERVIITK